jgi:adenylyl-sulfate kinase
MAMGTHSGVTVEERVARCGHRGAVIWLTGLSGSGKSTLATGLERSLFLLRYQAVSIDGDKLRRGLCSDLGFDRHDRSENVRRASEVAVFLAQTGFVCIVALIAPFAADRARARSLAAGQAVVFVEVFVDVPLSLCERRDSKGLYQLARSGELEHFTGVSDPYEVPEAPDVHVRADLFEPQACVEQVMAAVLPRLREGTTR